MLFGQPPVYNGLCGNGMQFSLLIGRYHVGFADGCACVWRGRIERFHPKNIIQRNCYDGGSVMIWDQIGYYDKTGLVEVKATPNSQPYREGIVVAHFLKLCHFGTRVKLPVTVVNT
jgi:hypothetical protein